MRRYDDDPTLSDLLSTTQRERVLAALQVLAGAPVFLSDNPGAGPGIAIELNLEDIGTLSGELEPERLAAAAEIVQMLAISAARYRVAANMHVDGMQERYEALQAKHEALQASEARYRTLSSELQRRVDAQVAQIADTQQRLYESAHLRAVGQLAAGVAHEINTPAGFITSNLCSATQYLDDIAALLPSDSASNILQDFRDLVAESLDGAKRIAAIVAHLRTFANIDDAEFVPCDMAKLAETAASLLQTDLPPGVLLEVETRPVPMIAGFPARISEAIYNVLRNAAQAAAGDGGLVRLSVGEEDGLVTLCIDDNGPGINEDIRDRVFDPFFTTRDVGSGAGLGLTVARDVMRAHHGSISVGSSAGGGCRARLQFHSGV